jgi:tRNA(fMet)-specific endonuclease VapC
MGFLIDTDTVIFSLKGNESVNANFRLQRDAPKMLSVITYGELVYGAKKSARVDKNLAVVRRVAELFPIIDVTPAIMDTFGDLKAGLQKRGKPLDDMDLLIAATAMNYGLVLVTNNLKHFKRIKGLDLVNWSLVKSG